MPEPGDLVTPAVAFLESIERQFAVRYPERFKAFCSDGGIPDVPVSALHAASVEFICDLHRLREVNIKVGEEEWGDYEEAIAGRRHAKDGERLWGGILPFATQDDSDLVFGFDFDEPESDQVLVWSIHTIVYVYPSFAAFCAQFTSRRPTQEAVDRHAETNLASWKREVLFYERLVNKRHLTQLAPLARLVRSLSESPTARAFCASHSRATLVVSTKESHGLVARHPFVEVAIEAGCRFAIRYCNARCTPVSSEVAPGPEAEATLQRMLSMLRTDTRGREQSA